MWNKEYFLLLYFNLGVIYNLLKEVIIIGILVRKFDFGRKIFNLSFFVRLFFLDFVDYMYF